MNVWLERALSQARERAVWLAWACVVIAIWAAQDENWFGVGLAAVVAVGSLSAAARSHRELKTLRQARASGAFKLDEAWRAAIVKKRYEKRGTAIPKPEENQ